jgi:hypothetical protein
MCNVFLFRGNVIENLTVMTDLMKMRLLTARQPPAVLLNSNAATPRPAFLWDGDATEMTTAETNPMKSFTCAVKSETSRPATGIARPTCISAWVQISASWFMPSAMANQTVLTIPTKETIVGGCNVWKVIVPMVAGRASVDPTAFVHHLLVQMEQNAKTSMNASSNLVILLYSVCIDVIKRARIPMAPTNAIVFMGIQIWVMDPASQSMFLLENHLLSFLP